MHVRVMSIALCLLVIGSVHRIASTANPDRKKSERMGNVDDRRFINGDRDRQAGAEIASSPAKSGVAYQLCCLHLLCSMQLPILRFDLYQIRSPNQSDEQGASVVGTSCAWVNALGRTHMHTTFPTNTTNRKR